MKSMYLSSLLGACTLLGSAAASGPLATFQPCPSCPSSVRPSAITITEELQTVSTCTPSTICTTTTHDHTATQICSTQYSYDTYLWVSTVIPLPYKPGNVTVTETEELVTVNHVSTDISYYTTITPTVTPSFSVFKNHTTQVTPTAKPTPYTVLTHVDVVVIDFIVEFKEIGPLAIAGYPGPSLCTDCTSKTDGSVTQSVDVHKCVNAKCSDYSEVWVWMPPKSTSTTSVISSTTSLVCQTPGTYTATVIPEVCATTTVYALPQQSWVPTTVTWMQTTMVCPTPGVYTATLVPEVCHTTVVTAPQGQQWQATTVGCETIITEIYTFYITETINIIFGTTSTGTIIPPCTGITSTSSSAGPTTTSAAPAAASTTTTVSSTTTSVPAGASSTTSPAQTSSSGAAVSTSSAVVTTSTVETTTTSTSTSSTTTSAGNGSGGSGVTTSGGAGSGGTTTSSGNGGNNPGQSTTSTSGAAGISTTTGVTSTSSSSVTPTPIPEGSQVTVAGEKWESQGCFGSSSGYTGFSLVATDGLLTVENCLAACGSSKLYAGLHTSGCYCGDSITSASQTSAGSCSLPCPGDASEVCGGDSTGTSKRQLSKRIASGILLSIFENLGPVSSTTTTTSTPTTTSSTPNPSDDVNDAEATAANQARALDYKEMPANVVRRGGLLKARKQIDQEVAQKAANIRKRDFGLKPTAMLES